MSADSDQASTSSTTSEETSTQSAWSLIPLGSVSEVDTAIKACKQRILETTENSDGRKAMVDQLIKLRIRLQDLIDKQDRRISTFEARGHSFVSYHEPGRKYPIPGVDDVRRVYCQSCTGSIWVHLQSSQHCFECGYSAHTACLSDMKRECVAQKIRTKPDFIMNICPEASLPSLKYRCVECDRQLSPTDPSCEPRLCDYTGLSFCPTCHWNTGMATPARIVHNWEFEPHPVSQAASQYLSLMYKKPVINVRQINPKLLAVVPELYRVDQLRKSIIMMKKYLTVCRIALKEKLLLLLKGRQHFVDSDQLYSLDDLVEVRSGYLLQYLDKITTAFSEHIRRCVLCVAKGFICEVCKSKHILFPFDDLVAICSSCHAVFHAQCFQQARQCQRCHRIKSKKTMKSNQDVDVYQEEDPKLSFPPPPAAKDVA